MGSILSFCALFPASRDPMKTDRIGVALIPGGLDVGLLRFLGVLDSILRYWGSLLERGATTFWEHYQESWPRGFCTAAGMSLCHGWSVGPTYSLPAHVLGVQPLEPGFAKVLVEPRPADLAWATGAVPTPRGPVDVKWTRNAEELRMSLRLPATCPAKVSLPRAGPHARVIADGVATETATEGNRVVFDVGPGDHEILQS